MSLVSEIMRYATPMLVDRIAAAVGINSTLARTALSYALPSILGAFTSRASTPAGANALFDAVKGTDPNMLGSLEGMLGGAGKDQLMKGGTSMLSSILGQGGVDGLLSGLTKNAGIGSGAAAALLPLVGQMALGGLAKNASGMDASGLANMLSSQKSSFEATMPSGVSDAARHATQTAQQAVPSAGAGIARWLIPLAAALAALWYFMSGPSTDMKKVAVDATKTTTETMTGVMVEGVDVSGTLTKTFGDLTTTIGTMTNADTAKAALPKLEEAVKSVDGIAAVASKMTADQKGIIGKLITAGIGPVKLLAEKVLATQGVGEIAKPVLDGLFAKIEGLAK
jgi:Bacterial protein of unknown function (DUF937)